jgi:hypothetical protein
MFSQGQINMTIQIFQSGGPSNNPQDPAVITLTSTTPLNETVFEEDTFYVAYYPEGESSFSWSRAGAYSLYDWRTPYPIVGNAVTILGGEEYTIFISDGKIHLEPLNAVKNASILNNSTFVGATLNQVNTFVNNIVDDEADLRIAGDALLQDQIDNIGTVSFGSVAFAEYTFLGQLNFPDYLFLGVQNYKPSGSSSNGFQFQNCVPYLVPFSGILSTVNLRARGVAVSTAAADPTLTMRFSLWNVGIGVEGTKLADLDFIYPVTPNTGIFNNSAVDTNLYLSQPFSVPVTAGMLLGIKFEPITGSNSGISSFHNAIVSLKLSELSE